MPLYYNDAKQTKSQSDYNIIGLGHITNIYCCFAQFINVFNLFNIHITFVARDMRLLAFASLSKKRKILKDPLDQLH